MRVEAERDRRELFRNKRALRGREHAHGDIGVAAQQVVGGIARDDLDDELRMLATQRGKNRREVLDGDDLAGAEAYGALDRLRAGTCGAQQRRGAGLERFGLRTQAQRQLGRDEAALRAHEERRAERRLQRVELAPDRRLREAEGPCCARQRAVAKDCEKGAIEAPIRIAHTFSYNICSALANFR